MYDYNLKKVGDIGVSYEGVESVLANVSVLYDQLKVKIDKLNEKKDGISEYWESQEASNFVDQMDTVSNYFSQFCTEYQYFIELLNKVLDLYRQEEKSILLSLEKYAAIKDSI